MKGQTGVEMALGKDIIYNSSIKQKINTRSSTKSELVATYDAFPQTLRTKHFLQEQHCDADGHRIMRDNQRTMLLEINGKASSRKRTNHVNLRYFFLKDYLQDNDNKITIKCCPTKEMIADFFTKPLQEYEFKKLRALIMGLDEVV